jgi:hypothetical protein
MKFTSLVYTPKGAAEALTLPDDGCSGVIVSREFVQLHRLDTAKATEPVQLRLANGKSVGAMDTIARVKMRIGDHVSEDWMWVTELASYDVIVGQPWLEQHDALKQYRNRTILFNSAHCHSHCLQHGKAVKVSCKANSKSEIDNVDHVAPRDNIAVITAEAALAYGRRDESCLT